MPRLHCGLASERQKSYLSQARDPLPGMRSKGKSSDALFGSTGLCARIRAAKATGQRPPTVIRPWQECSAATIEETARDLCRD